MAEFTLLIMGSKSGPTPTLPLEEWKHRPTYICAHPTTKTPEYEPGASLPLGVPINFESDIFQGKVFLRLKPIPSDQEHDSYFESKKRHYQFIIQGQFKEELSLCDVIMGNTYDKPLKGLPNGTIMKMYEKFMEVISPGLDMCMTSDTPSLFNALGSCQTMRVDRKGEEPDVSSGKLKEDTTLLFGKEKFASASKRRTYLCKPKNSSKYKVNLDQVYTFECYDHSICFASYYQHIMLGQKIDMVKTMNGQPLCLALFTRDDHRVIAKFAIWHERLLEEMEKEQEAKM